MLNYKQCKNQYGSDYKIKKLIKTKKLFKVQDGIYSTEEYNSELGVISMKYPAAVFTMDSAFYFHALTDVIPDVNHLATKREATRIHAGNIRQYFIKDELFDIGKISMNYQGDEIQIYNLERMLIELIRNKARLPFDYYKEIIGNYRNRVSDMDFGLVGEYAGHFKMGQKIMNTIQMEVL